MDKITPASRAASALSKARWAKVSKEDRIKHSEMMRSMRVTDPSVAVTNWWANATPEQRAARTLAAHKKRWPKSYQAFYGDENNLK